MSLYDDARTIWLSKSRVFTGNLPHMEVAHWNTLNWDDPFCGQVLREIFDSGYYTIGIYTNQHITDRLVDGYTGLLDYMVHNPGSTVTMSYPDNFAFYYFAVPAAYLTNPPINYVNDGSHIPLTARFEDAGGVPEAAIFTVPGAPKGAFVVAPIASQSYYISSGWDVYNNHPNYGKSIKDILDANGITVSGIMFNLEDFAAPNYETIAGASPYAVVDRYNADTHYDKDSREYDIQSLVASLFGELVDARITNIFASGTFPNALSWNSCIFAPRDADSYFRGSSRIEVLKINNRPRYLVSAYAYSVATQDLRICISILGEYSRKMSLHGMHIYDAWLSIRTYQAVAGLLTVNETIALTKIALTLGGYRICQWHDYDWLGRAYYPDSSHIYWSCAIALDEMQPYYQYILDGVTYQPPPELSRPVLLTATHAYASDLTPFYHIDSGGNTIDDNAWICCRIYNHSVMCIGASSDSTTRTYTINSPLGGLATVECTPTGTVTIL